MNCSVEQGVDAVQRVAKSLQRECEIPASFTSSPTSLIQKASSKKSHASSSHSSSSSSTTSMKHGKKKKNQLGEIQVRLTHECRHAAATFATFNPQGEAHVFLRV